MAVENVDSSAADGRLTRTGTDDRSLSVADPACGGKDPQRAGWFRFFFNDQRWEWSPQVGCMYGYHPDEVVPTTELVLSHQHPDDDRSVVATLQEIRRTSRPVSGRHRIIDALGRIHYVAVVADVLYDDAGAVVGARGFYVDIDRRDQEREERVSQAVAEIAENRAAIEQTKGMLMLIYRIDAETAFELLRWRSQETNVKLRLIAEQLSGEFLALHYDETLPPRTTYDQLLLTTHRQSTNGHGG
jgi:PAS domain S-box-containing protein